MKTQRMVLGGLGMEAMQALRLSQAGEILECQGGEDQPLAEALSYVAEALDGIGELMGIDQFLARELELDDGRCLARREAGGELLIIRPGGADLESLRQRLGLV